jgi:hypothetical protein
MSIMFSLPSLLAFLLPLPAFSEPEEVRRHRSLKLLDLPRHLRHDVGIDDMVGTADDPRWSRRFDLER